MKEDKKERLDEIAALVRKERKPLEDDEEVQKHMREFIQRFAVIQDKMEPLKQNAKELQEVYKENGWLTSDQIRLAKRVLTLLQSDLPIEDLPKAIDMFIEGGEEIGGGDTEKGMKAMLGDQGE